MTAQKYYIAWHPEYGYEADTLRFDREEVETQLENSMYPEHEKWEIRSVHLIDSDKVREMWEKLYSEHKIGVQNMGYFIQLLKQILPEPKD